MIDPLTSKAGLNDLIFSRSGSLGPSSIEIVSPLNVMGTQSFQEAPSTEITKAFTKWSYCVQKTNELNDVLDEALGPHFFPPNGTDEKRKFGILKGALKINLHKSLNLDKELSFSTSSESEITTRDGDPISSLNLFSHQLNTSLNAELAKKFFIQTTYKHLNANGNEFLTQRDNFGNIINFTLTQVNQKDHMLCLGMLYKFRENVYANLQYNWWGMTFNEQDYLDYKYNRLILILSVEL